jgi:hypothetical protein
MADTRQGQGFQVVIRIGLGLQLRLELAAGVISREDGRRWDIIDGRLQQSMPTSIIKSLTRYVWGVYIVKATDTR